MREHSHERQYIKVLTTTCAVQYNTTHVSVRLTFCHKDLHEVWLAVDVTFHASKVRQATTDSTHNSKSHHSSVIKAASQKVFYQQQTSEWTLFNLEPEACTLCLSV